MINEYQGQTFYCDPDELFPPADAVGPAFYLPFPLGLGGSQICQITSGDVYLRSGFFFSADLDSVWVNFAVLVGGWLLLLCFLYAALRWLPAGKAATLVVGVQKNTKKSLLNLGGLAATSKLYNPPANRTFKSTDQLKPRNEKAEPTVPTTEQTQEDTNEESYYPKLVNHAPNVVFSHISLSVPVQNLSGVPTYPLESLNNLKRKSKSILDDSEYSSSKWSHSKRNQQLVIHDISGYVKAGQILAVVCPVVSTRLAFLKLLAGKYANSQVQGELFVNGFPLKEQLKYVGFVEKEDVLLQNATITETLKFAALNNKFKMPGPKDKTGVVNQILKLIECEDVRYKLVKECRGELRKRVRIGVDIALGSTVLIIDDPFSGNSLRSQLRLAQLLKKIAALKVCTIVLSMNVVPQGVWSFLQKLLILSSAGRAVYFGRLNHNLHNHNILAHLNSGRNQYFRGYLLEELGVKVPNFTNLSDFIHDLVLQNKIIDTITPKKNENSQRSLRKSVKPDPKDLYRVKPLDHPEDYPNDMLNIYLNSKTYVDLLEKVDSLKHETTTQDNLSNLSTPSSILNKALSFIKIFYVLRRGLLTYWRDPFTSQIKVLRLLLLGLLFGFLFYNLGDTPTEARLRASLLYFTILFTNLNSASSVPRIMEDKEVYLREKSSGMYSAWMFITSLIVNELPFICAGVVLFCLPAYFLPNLPSDAGRFFFFLFLYFLLNLVSLGCVQFICMAVDSPVAASALSNMLFGIFSVFSGFLIRRPNIPHYWIWMHYASFTMYPLESLTIDVLDGLELDCSLQYEALLPITSFTYPNGQHPVYPICSFPDGNAYINYFGFELHRKWINVGALIGFYLVFVLLAIFFVLIKKRK